MPSCFIYNCTVYVPVVLYIMCFYIDIDECTLNIDDCNQLCVNDIGSYHCECYDGYIRGTNSSSCVG